MAYTQNEIDAKINSLYNNIFGNLEWQEDMKSMLREMAQYDVGKQTIMDMPENVTFHSEDATDMKNAGIGGIYIDNQKRIILPDSIVTDAKRQSRIIALAHEMRHAIQDSNKQREILTPFPSERHVQEKLCEMETKLQDIIFENQLRQGKNEEKSAGCLFYEAEIQRYQDKGLSKQEAERSAKTSVVQAYWSGLNDLPKDCSLITQDLKDEINHWNYIYDKQSLLHNNLRLNVKKDPVSVFDFYQAEKLEQKEIEDEKIKEPFKIPSSIYEHLKAPTLPPQKNDAIIPQYIKNMDVNLPENYFTQTHRQRATTGDYFILTQYPNGNKKDEIILLPEGYYRREFSEENNIALYEEQVNKNGEKIVEISRNNNGNLEYEIRPEYTRTYYEKNGKLKKESTNDYIKTYYEDGNLKSEKSLKDNIFEGPAKEYYDNENNTLKSESMYKNEKLHGMKKTYNENLVLISEEPYQNGKLDGIVKKYNNESILISEEPYKNGELDGIVKKYFENKQIESETPYVEGKIHGTQKFYNKRGDILAENKYKNGIPEDGIHRYYENEQIRLKGFYKDGKRDGITYRWDEKGNKFQCIFEKGKMISNWTPVVNEPQKTHSLKETLKNDHQEQPIFEKQKSTSLKNTLRQIQQTQKTEEEQMTSIPKTNSSINPALLKLKAAQQK